MLDLRFSLLKILIDPDNFWIYKYSYNVVLEYESTMDVFIKSE